MTRRTPQGKPKSTPPASINATAALAAALDPIVTIDARGTIQSASDSLQRVLGWAPAELIGQNVRILMPEPHHSAHDGYLSNYQRTGKTHIMNRPRRFEAVRKDGTLVPIELSVSRADVPGGAPLFVGIIRDMSAYAALEQGQEAERVRSERLLAEQTAALHTAHVRLRMADRMASIGTLAAGLGHDMNNVLLPVRARLNALKAAGESGKLAPGERKHVEEIRKSVAYLQQLADGLHFLALDPDAEEGARRDDDGANAATDLHEWWSQTGALLSKSVPKHVRVAASFSEDLPRIAVAVHGLTQAVLNLVVNAGESIPGPSERKRRQGVVRVRAEAVDLAGPRFVRLSVTDNGSGMTDEVRRRAIEMFFTTKPRGLGTGLGLALVHKVVERAGGRIEIDSELGKGTTVALILPAAQAAAARAGDRPEALVRVGDGRAGALMRHLLESSGVVAGIEGPLEDVRIWVTDAATTDLESIRNWRKKRPRGRLVLLGRPEERAASRWKSLEPVIIENPEDFQAVRAAIGRALEAQ